MKKILLVTALFFLTSLAFGQIDIEKYIISYSTDVKKQAVGIIAMIPDNGIYSIGLERQDAYSYGRDTAFEAQHGGQGIILERLDSSEVHLFVHGIFNMYEKGVLRIHIYPKNNYLIVEITDNGKGFNLESETNGYGLKLSKERVRLLSASNAQQSVKLLMESQDTKGTTVYLTFKNWL